MDDDLALARALSGIRVVSIATNLPGPLAAATLRDFGAHVTKIEPPGGDPLASASPAWYAELHRDVERVSLDLKRADDRARADEIIARCDVLLASSRPSALERLGLDWSALHARHPHCCMVAIVGALPPHAEDAGHDLTYVAACGLVDPPTMPKTLVADLGGAERAASVALALLLARARTGVGAHAYVALAGAAERFAAAARFGLTAPTGVLGGAHAGYRLYRAADGWIAVAALEPKFFQALVTAFGADPAPAFARETAATFEAWGRANDVPIVVVGERSDALAFRST